MKRLLFLLMITLSVGTIVAQPKKSRVQQTQQAQQAKKQGSSSSMTSRMQISYPVALDVPEEVVWRRDLYREIDLNDEANSGLYYPVQPIDKQMNLFTYIFKLAQNNYIPIYEYSTANDGQDDFSDGAKLAFKTLLTDHHFYFTEENGKLHVDNSDIPSSEVTKYYLKECAYYDQANSSFHIKVLALCPIMNDPDFGSEPLFWVKYADLEPFLSRQSIKTSDVNDAAKMNLDDYFTMNKYKGKIYKTANRLGKTLAQIAGNDSTKYSAEQLRIEAELEAFRQNIFGEKAKKDSIDSLANVDPKAAKAARSGRNAKEPKEKTARVRTKRERSSSSSSSSGAARVSVRRERH
ncbi:MAG: gliding motility protein GldN [Prevotella sp.]|nr:gliding motility protein GldN [Prevotella sp.]